MRKAARWDYILARLAKDGDLDVSGLAEALGCSTATVRRDLRELDKHHLLSRVHGGAVSSGILYELPLRQRTAQQEEQKRWIAAEAVRRIEPGMAVGVTGGTTTAAMIRELINRRLSDVTVVTNSLVVAQDLSLHPNYKLVVTGGFIRPASLELVGPLPEYTIPRINLDLTLLGVDGVSVDAGLTIHNELEARTNELFMLRARTTIVLADHTKLGRAAFAQICPLHAIQEVVTDRDATAGQTTPIATAGVTVTRASAAATQ
ncbi:MAG: transcriptional regulator, DeoR family [Dactylosporangium sp.]|jgi:DeoR family transcriptional regulator of aga operon|nr:transcriptional regulator, DeoR family [Dactylosporangium sp.]